MKVLKFGGTSVGSAAMIQRVSALIRGERKIVVLSAMSGTTSTLISVGDTINTNTGCSGRDARKIIEEMHLKYSMVVDELFSSADTKDEAYRFVTYIITKLRGFSLLATLTIEQYNEILSYGEILSTELMNMLLREQGVKSVIIPATKFMRTNTQREPDMDYLKSSLTNLMEAEKEAEIIITQGFICLNNYGAIDNLERGGSDYSASLIGAALGCSEIQIWTDIDGMHNNDPRYIEGTTPVRSLHFDEAAELAYFGAKILHPTCILPARTAGIPVRLLNTMQPESEGTLISNEFQKGSIKAVAAKDNITAIKIKSGRMLLATGFLHRIFAIFEKYQTPIDMITTSEVGVSVTIDNDTHCEEISREMQLYGDVTIDRDMSIICVVGDFEWDNIGFEASIVNALRKIPVRMISYGGSNYNVSLLVKSSDKIRALKAISDNIFNTEKQ